MDLTPHWRLLRALAAVVQTGSTQAAAGALHVAQSSVARAVQQLEALLGQPVFERAGRGMVPTGAGRQLALRAGRALQFLADADRHRGRPAAAPDGVAWSGSPLARGMVARHVDVLRAATATGSEAAAAARLGISQPAVHQSLQQLEHMAGATLFVRSRRGLRVDEAGEALWLACRLALAELRQAEDEWQATTGHRLQGRLVVGTLPFSTTMLLAPAAGLLLAQAPGVQLVLIDGTYDALLAQLRSAEIDCIVGALRPQPPSDAFRQEALFDDRLAVVARPGHPLAGQAALVWEDLANAEWVMPMPDTPAQRAFDRMVAATGLPPPRAQVRANSAMLMQALVQDSDRLALMSPRQMARELAHGVLVELPLAVPQGQRSIGAVWRSDYLPNPAARQWQILLQQVANGLQPSDLQ